MVGWVDPRAGGELRWFGRLADEPFRACGVGGVEYAGTLVADCLGQAVVDVGGGMKGQPGVAMFIVVPTEEALAVQSSFLDRAEPAGEVGPVLQRLELGLADTVASCSTLCYIRRMARTIGQRELRNENAKVIDAVAAGESFVVTRNGEPVAELCPIRAGRRIFVTRDEVASLAGAAVRIDHRQFRADLDKVIDQGL